MALAMMAQAMRRVWGTSLIPNSRAMTGVRLGRRFAISSKRVAACPMPCSSVSAACSTALLLSVGRTPTGLCQPDRLLSRPAILIREIGCRPDEGRSRLVVSRREPSAGPRRLPQVLGYRRAMAASMVRGVPLTRSPSRSEASFSTSTAGSYSSMTTGERPGATISTSAWRPGWSMKV